jgi:hypothetical protein
MDIRNVTQYATFLRGNDMVRLDGMFQQVINCVENYAAGCNCYKLEDKRKLYDICNKLYIDSAKHFGHIFKKEFLSKTAERQINIYTENGQLIISISH